MLKNCQYCAEEIQEKAIKCKHCGGWFTEEVGNVNNEKDFIEEKEIKFFLSKKLEKIRKEYKSELPSDINKVIEEIIEDNKNKLIDDVFKEIRKSK